MAVLIESFAPFIKPGAQRLILGSMPGQASLHAQQYYAHPRNAFWPIMAQLFGWPAELSYPQRTQRLMAEGIALWDVLASCERAGSLDANINPQSTRCNALPELLLDYPDIDVILFNGGTAERLFRRFCLPQIAHPQHYRLLRLPSTSPAHASLSWQQKYAQWQAGLAGNGTEHQQHFLA